MVCSSCHSRSRSLINEVRDGYHEIRMWPGTYVRTHTPPALELSPLLLPPPKVSCRSPFAKTKQKRQGPSAKLITDVPFARESRVGSDAGEQLARCLLEDLIQCCGRVVVVAGVWKWKAGAGEKKMPATSKWRETRTAPEKGGTFHYDMVPLSTNTNKRTIILPVVHHDILVLNSSFIFGSIGIIIMEWNIVFIWL